MKIENEKTSRSIEMPEDKEKGHVLPYPPRFKASHTPFPRKGEIRAIND
jgi:hypothetical protein